MPHIHEQYDFIVAAYIVHDDRVLLVQHPRYGKWIPVGGHIELDEEPEEALVREITEETGLQVELLADKPPHMQGVVKFVPTPRYIDVHEANSPHRHIGLVYFARAKSDAYVISAEHTDLQWLSATDLDDLKYRLDESVKFYCRQALAVAKNQ
jgi:8-oxo-dGTP pyrophosphatase MutT (NUDIX family)